MYSRSITQSNVENACGNTALEKAMDLSNFFNYTDSYSTFTGKERKNVNVQHLKIIALSWYLNVITFFVVKRKTDKCFFPLGNVLYVVIRCNFEENLRFYTPYILAYKTINYGQFHMRIYVILFVLKNVLHILLK